MDRGRHAWCRENGDARALPARTRVIRGIASTELGSFPDTLRALLTKMTGGWASSFRN